VELGQLNPTVAVRGPHHRNLGPNVLEPNDKVHPRSLHWHLALQFHTKFDKECLRGIKVIDHDENVVHSFKRHVGGSCGFFSQIMKDNAAHRKRACFKQLKSWRIVYVAEKKHAAAMDDRCNRNAKLVEESFVHQGP